MAEKIPDRRKFSRIHFDTQAHLSANGHRWDTLLHDISFRGALVDIPKNWQGKKGDHYTLKMDLEGTDITISMEVSVAHIDKNSLGLHCEKIALDDMTHLRRIVELNLGDETLLHRELANLCTPD